MVDAACGAIVAMQRWHDIQTSVADAVALAVSDADIDTTIAIHMFYDIADAATGLKEMGELGAGGMVAVVLNPAGTAGELSALARAPFEGYHNPQPEPLSSEHGPALMQDGFASADVSRYDDKLRGTDPVDLLGYLSNLPIADEPVAIGKLAATVEDAFDRAGGGFTITKASELLIGRR